MDVDAADAQALAKQLRALDAKELLAVALDALKRDAAPLAARSPRASRSGRRSGGARPRSPWT